MINNTNKKLIFYEVNPLFFYDSNNDGFGDFKGISQKIDYFIFMGIDCVIIPDVFNNYNTLLFNNFINLKSKYGTINDLKEMIENFKKNKIDFAVEVNIKDIDKSLLFSVDGSIHDKEDEENKKSFFLDRNETQNWNSKKTIESFQKIIKFWLSIGVLNFVFVNFENMFSKHEIFDRITKSQIRQLYKMVKEINAETSVIIKSALLSETSISQCLRADKPAADYFINASYSLLGTNSKNKNDKLEKFNPTKFYLKLKHSLKSQNLNKKVVLSLGSSLSGRINSRWGNEGLSKYFSAKAFITLSLTSPSSSLIYYGDELGVLKTDIKNNESFYDIYAIERKRLMESQGQKLDDFILAQQYLSPINTQSLFQWDQSVNGGFSKGLVTIRQLSTTYQEINVANQYNNNDSPLFYFKNLIAFIKNPIYCDFFDNSISSLKIKFYSKGIIKYTYKVQQDKLFILINISDKWKKINISSKLKVIFSNYTEKKYAKKIKMIAPFESIILFSKKDLNL